jgi:drug/metabolite transporter (DMT)-like permease
MTSESTEKEIVDLEVKIPQAQQQKNGTNIFNLIKGSCCLLIYLCTWETGAIISQKVQQNYTKPYFLSWLRWTINIGFLMFYLPYVQSKRKKNGNEPFKIKKKDWVQALILFTLDISANSLYIFSLHHTIVNIANTICMGSSVWSYLFSIFILKEDITIWKNASVILLLTGVILIIILGRDVTSSSEEQSSTVFGYILLILGEIKFALFGVLYSKLRNDKKSIDETIIFIGMMALINITLFWIPLIPMHYSGFEVFEIPSLNTVFWIIPYVLTKPLSAVSLFMGFAFVGPVFITTGAVLILPLGNITELILTNTTYNRYYYVGMTIILLAFVCYSYGEYSSRKRQDDKEKLKTNIDDPEISESKDEITEKTVEMV